jgi:hypothetical protein
MARIVQSNSIQDRTHKQKLNKVNCGDEKMSEEKTS